MNATDDVEFDDPEAGMTTAEYAVGTVAAVAFAGLLYGIVTSSAVHDLLLGIITKALHST